MRLAFLFGGGRDAARSASYSHLAAGFSNSSLITALDAWNAERKRRDEAPFTFGIGLNCRPAVIGDVGSEQIPSFTVIGDTVNTASRLQGLAP